MTSGCSRIVLLFWLMVSSMGLIKAQCPQGKTVFVWVNGVWVKDLPTWQTTVDNIQSKFFASHPNLNQACISFQPVYNHSVNLYRDLLQSNYQLAMQDVDKYLNDLSLLNTAPKAHQSFMAAALGYQKDLLSSDPDMAVLDQTILDWWSQGYRVVLVGHSQGTLYTNAAYNIRLRNSDGRGKQLPDSNQLSVVNIATPANNVADGRQMYTTHCNDFIYYAPNNVGGKALSWNVRDSLVACAAASTANFFLNLFSAAGELVKVGYSVSSHSLGRYMADNGNTQKQIYGQMENSLPHPGCGSEINCYLKDDFRSVDYTGNWLQVGDLQAAKNSSVRQVSGLLEFYTRGYFMAGGMSSVYAPGKFTLRTRRVFTGKFTANISVNHIGGGQSIVRLKKAADDSTAITLNINNGPGQNSVTVSPAPAGSVYMPTATGFGGFRQLVFTKTDSQVSLGVGAATWSVNASDLTSGYYLEVESLGDNTLQIKDLTVARTLPPSFSFTAAQSKATVEAGKSIDFAFSLKSNNGYSGKVTITPYGLPSGASAVGVSVDVPANQTVNGKITVSTNSVLKIGDYAFTVTAVGPGLTIGPIMQTLTVVPAIVPATTPSLNEVFTGAYSTNWNYVVGSGNPTVTQTSGNLRIQASKSGAAGIFTSKQVFTAPFAAEFTFAHYGYGRTSVFVLPSSGDQRIANADLDTNDCNYLNFSVPGKSTDWKYQGSSYMNRKVVIRIEISGTTTKFYADGKLMETMTTTGTGPYRLGFSVSSISWKSGDNITDFYGVKVTAGGVTTPTTGTVNVSATKDGSVYSGSLSCTLTASPGGQKTINSLPISLASQPIGSYSLSCVAPTNTTITGIAPTSSQNLSAGGVIGFVVAFKTNTVITQPLSNVVCSVSTTAAKINETVTYTASWTGGSGSPGFNWSGYVSGTTRIVSRTYNSPGSYTASVVVMDNGKQLTAACPTVTVANATVTVYANPLAVPPSGTYWTWNLSAWQWQGSSWVIQPVLSISGTNYRFDHPAGYIEAFKQIKSWGGSGPLDQCISQFQNALPYWPPYVVVGSAPTASLSVSWFSYSPSSPKTTDTITLNFTGTGFNSGTQVWVFGINCVNGCQAGVVASSVTATSMQALAQLRSVDNFQIKLRNGSSGNFILAGTVPVR